MMFTTLGSAVGIGLYSYYWTRKDIEKDVDSKMRALDAWFD